jgi:DNA helicase IV
VDLWISNKIKEIFSEQTNQDLKNGNNSYSSYIKEAISKLIDSNQISGLFDEIIIDEGQDLLSETYIYFLLDTALKGGIDKGRWRIFYDAQLQSELFHNLNQEVLETLAHTNHVNYYLEQNCRNSKKIIENITKLTAFTQSPFVGALDGTMVFAYSYSSDADQWAKIAAILNKVDREKVNRERVDIISFCGQENSIGRKMENKLADWHIRLLTPENLNNLLGYSGLSSIFKYKGLENDIIILTDVSSFSSSMDKAQLYTSMSRAKHQLYMLIDEHVIQEYDAKINN